VGEQAGSIGVREKAYAVLTDNQAAREDDKNNSMGRRRFRPYYQPCPPTSLLHIDAGGAENY
jgi:hypothetical protein